MRLLKIVSVAAVLFVCLPIATRAQTAAPTGQREPGLYMTFQTDKGNIACKLFEELYLVGIEKIRLLGEQRQHARRRAIHQQRQGN